MADPEISIIIPVFNSESSVGLVIDRTAQLLAGLTYTFEIICVNDGSRDSSWRVLKEKASHLPELKAINLLRNYGQHTAMYCGLIHARGQIMVTLDDDLQNPPEEIPLLLGKIREGHDLVFGQFQQKEHSFTRRIGSRLVNKLNERIFHKPEGLVISNFRALSRPLVDKMVSYKTLYPYINGLALMFCESPANVPTEHAKRRDGKSHYNVQAIAKLMMRIIFNYSSFPLHAVSTLGIVASVGSLGVGVFVFLKAILIGTAVPGWASLIVFLSFINAITILILSMLGEYMVRILNQISTPQIYHTKDIIHGNA